MRGAMWLGWGAVGLAGWRALASGWDRGGRKTERGECCKGMGLRLDMGRLSRATFLALCRTLAPLACRGVGWIGHSRCGFLRALPFSSKRAAHWTRKYHLTICGRWTAALSTRHGEASSRNSQRRRAIALQGARRLPCGLTAEPRSSSRTQTGRRGAAALTAGSVRRARRRRRSAAGPGARRHG